MKWLCTFGLHKFKPWAINSLVNPIPVERCERCGTGRQWAGHGGQIRYTKAQLDEASRAVESKTETSKAEAQNEIYRDALERIFRADGATMGEHPRSVAGKFQGIAERALGDANRVGKVEPEVEYWIEPLPGSGAKIQAFKAQSKQHGLHWLTVESKKYEGHYQLRPRVRHA
jgi:hypothetical protein